MSKEKFTLDELDIIDSIPSPFPMLPPTPVYRLPISVRENRDLLFSGKRPMWLPSSADVRMFAPCIIPDNVARGFVMDTERLDPSEYGGKDFFGVEWEYVPEVHGSMVRPGKPFLEDIEEWTEKVVFPDLSAYDWEGSAKKNEEMLNSGLVQIWVMNGLFERLISFMDFEGAAMALIDEDQQDAVKALFDRLCDFYDELIGYYAKYYHPYSILFHDDWGSQRAPFFSLDTCLEMVAPYLKRVAASCHKHGIVMEFHCCGHVELLVPAMIEANVDCWAGQPMNDRKKLVALYGDKFVFGVPMPETSDDMSDEEIEAIADQFMADFCSNGGRVIPGRTPSLTRMGGFSNDQRLRNALYIRARKAYDEENGN